MKEHLKKKFHILYLIDELKVKGGTEKHLLELAVGMVERGHTVSVFCLAEGPYAEAFKNAPLFFYNCLHVTRIYNINGIKALFQLTSYIREHAVDYVQTFHTASDLIGPIAARLSTKPVIVLSSRRDLGYTKSRRHSTIQRFVNKSVNGILANSLAVKQAVLKQEGECPEKITIIYNGITIEPFTVAHQQRSVQREIYGFSPTDVVVGSVGNIRPVKGYGFLVEAAAIICNSYNNVYFLHAGEGEQMNSLLCRCRELGLEHRFRFMGKTTDVPLFLSALDIYVQPSLSEGFSNAILEAMAAGLPVVATCVGGNPEVVDDEKNGYLVEPNNSEAIIGKLKPLIVSGQLRTALGEAARTKVKAKHDISSMMHAYEEFYYGCVASKSIT